VSELFARRFRERLERASISPGTVDFDRLEQYYKLLEKWNEHVNLTSLPLVGFPTKTLDRLLVEPLIAAELVKDEPYPWFDIGSGGGSPAIPLRITRRQPKLTMVESVGKKAAYLREAVRSLQLKNAAVSGTRIETMATELPRGSVQLITVRAVRLSEGIVDALVKLLYPNGHLLIFSKNTEAPPGFRTLARRQLPDAQSEVTLLTPS
jgi:16S rRNA (guanine527-N7)-methyltransferase